MAKQWVLVEGVVFDRNARPEHPIVIPPEEPGTEPPPVDEGAHPEHPIYYPPVPAHPIYLPPYPEHPIVLPPEGGGGEGIWGPNDPRPQPPIENPPPGGEVEQPPDGTWGGAGEPFPTPPIVIVPPQGDLPEIPDDKWLVVVMTPDGDLEWALIPAGGPPGNLPPAVQPV